VVAIEECATKSLPDLLVKAERMVNEADDVRTRAEPEFERLDFVKKGQAIMYTCQNIKNLSKLPGVIQAATTAFKSDFQEIQDALNEIKTNKEQLQADSKACAYAQAVEPPACY